MPAVTDVGARLIAPARSGGRRPDVLIHPEQVRRVVLVLDSDQSLVVVTVGCLDPFLSLVHHEARISDLAPLTARVYTLTRRSATISPPERGGG